MIRAWTLPGPGARVLPIGNVEYGALCDPGIPCRPQRLELRPEGTFVAVVTEPDGYAVLVPAATLAVTPPRLRDRPGGLPPPSAN